MLGLLLCLLIASVGCNTRLRLDSQFEERQAAGGVALTTRPLIYYCRSPNMVVFTCWWHPLANLTEGEEVNYVLTYSIDKEPKGECPDYKSAGVNSCHFDASHTFVWNIYCMKVKAVTARQNFTSPEHCFDVADIVKTEAPINLTYELMEAGGDEMGHDVLLSWSYPRPVDLQYGWITLVHELKYRRVSEPDEWKFKESLREPKVQLLGLPNDDYVIRVRCRSHNYGLWSNWSQPLMMSIPSQAPAADKLLVLILVTSISIVALLAIAMRLSPQCVRVKDYFLPPIPKPRIIGIDSLLLKELDEVAEGSGSLISWGKSTIGFANMASASESDDQTVPNGEDEDNSIQGIQSRYLRCSSPSLSMMSESRFSAISGSDAASIFMEPIHLSSAVAAKKIINEELPPRGVRTESIPESMLETAEQLMVEDLYNRVRDMIDDRSPYNTPCVLDIQRAMVQDRLEPPSQPVDEVWPNIFIAEKSVAVNKARLKRMGITHVLNAAHGTGVYTGEAFYSGMGVQYMGVEVDDFLDADISPHFRPTAEFLDEALLTHKGKVVVVSMMGVSRSAVLVASYLMIFQHMTIMEALTAIRKKRPINPNEAFLKQLRQLNEDLLEERDDDETLSQCSVIDARTRARIFGEDNETDTDEAQSMIEVKANSIMMEEEEDGNSVMSTVASSAAAEELRSRPRDLEIQPSCGVHEKSVLPEQVERGEDVEDEDGLDRMIHEWQRRNEQYQSDEWWEAQLNSDDENGAPADADVESVTSEDVRALKERLKRRNRHPPSDAVSTSSCTSYADLWKQRLQEIEEEASARYRKKDDKEGQESDGKHQQESKKKIDDEMESILSDSTSMYNFCQKNKEKMTPLERWRVKRIHFGWNKKDRDNGEKSSVGDHEKSDDAEVTTPSFEDVNLTAYQAWKRRQQRRFGEENMDEILEMSRGEDSATVKRRQRREEILERSKKTLEESQSMCGWENESCVSGTTIPLSAFWAGAGVTGAPTVVNDDNMSMISGQSSVRSSASQACSIRASHASFQPPPIVPVPTVQGPSGEPMVNLASIQNWIANVVSETIKQKQNEMSLPPPSLARSDVSFGAPSSVSANRVGDDDKASMLSGRSYCSSASQGRGRLGSVFSAESYSDVGTRGSKNKITTTSVPLFSLFQDQVNLGKLDEMDKEIKSDIRGKMATYEKKKILEDNKRSTLYKKKKSKEDEDEEEVKRKEEEFLQEAKKKKQKPVKTFGLSGCLNLNPALENDKNTSVDEWLKSVRPPPRKAAATTDEDPYDDLDGSASQFDFSSRRVSCDREDDDNHTFSGASNYLPQMHPSDGNDIDNHRKASRSYNENHDVNDLISRRKFTNHSEYKSNDTEREGRDLGGDDEEEDVAAFIAQTRQRARARAAAEDPDDEVLAAWRAQLDAKRQGQS
ncbi:serine/threonine/tyrosine-interacting-like protein 2 isoform X2 [Corythoichthys intestinalis]|uniref:serine/threonine/tyrosine-interacting-like protein 2 isoform X2 n=1 Tax=Corythoichthys intestinalis TaxID=161448 RepID=UPI0025A4DFD9|nr:serine/threonine/tyrosine-interacting-like protein 2 isoform X2 [Corythoichthys intestinalis]